MTRQGRAGDLTPDPFPEGKGDRRGKRKAAKFVAEAALKGRGTADH
jgi:hypothetical protein